MHSIFQCIFITWILKVKYNRSWDYTIRETIILHMSLETIEESQRKRDVFVVKIFLLLLLLFLLVGTKSSSRKKRNHYQYLKIGRWIILPIFLHWCNNYTSISKKEQLGTFNSLTLSVFRYNFWSLTLTVSPFLETAEVTIRDNICLFICIFKPWKITHIADCPAAVNSWKIHCWVSKIMVGASKLSLGF